MVYFCRKVKIWHEFPYLFSPVTKDINSRQKSIASKSNIIYDRLLDLANAQPPEILIEEFKNLFARGKNEDMQASEALQKILAAPVEQKQFDRIFSHCFYLIFNCWLNSNSSSRIFELLETIEFISNSSSYDRRRKQLIQLVTNYQTSKSYLDLKAIVAIVEPQSKELGTSTNKSDISQGIKKSASGKDITVNDCLERYTFLYKYFVPSDSKLQQLKELLYSLEISRQRDFELKLSKYIIYRFRLKQFARMKLLAKGAGKAINKVSSPSILSERAFGKALKQYIGKVENGKTLLERSQLFVRDNQVRSSYKVFKKDLHRFLIKDIKSRNSEYQFEQKLKDQLQQTFPNADERPLNNTLILQTCRQLFSFLVAELDSNHSPQNFATLVTNLGTAQVMKILVKLLLICPESRSDLEKKIAIVVNHYQLHDIQDIPWLVKTLEHLLIALAIYFGEIDVSIAKSSISD